MTPIASRTVSVIWALGMLGALVAGAACSDDPIPEYEPLPARPQQRPTEQPPAAEQVAAEAEEAKPEGAQPEDVAAASPRRDNGRLSVQLEQPVLVYPMPGLSWQASRELPAGTRLFIVGRYECGAGNVWLRFALNGDESEWLRLEDSGLSAQDVEPLPELSMQFHTARMRWDRFAEARGARAPADAFAANHLPNEYLVLGRSADSNRVALWPSSRMGSFVMWVSAGAVELDSPIVSLPVYIGECCVRALPSRLAIAEVLQADGAFAARPDGRFAEHRLRGDSGQQFPIIGRSADAAWIALRVDALDPNIVWMPIHQLSLNVTAGEVPIIIAGGTEALSSDSHEGFAARYAATEAFDRWRWLSDGSVAGTNRDGVWQWHPDTGTLQLLATGPATMVFSPDGTYAASQHCSEQSTSSEHCQPGVAITAIDAHGLGEPIAFPEANLIRFDSREPRQPYPSLMWAPNSRYLLAHGGRSLGPPWLILGVDGTHSVLPTELRPRWLADSTLLVEDEQEGYQVYRADGSLVRTIRFERAAGTRERLSTTEPMIVAAGRPRGKQQRVGYHMINLATGELTPLPTPSDHGVERQESRPHWAPLVFSGASLYFYRSHQEGRDDPDDERPLLRYDLRARTIEVVAEIRFDDQYSLRQVLCAGDCQRFAISIQFGPSYNVGIGTGGTATYIVETGAGDKGVRVIEVEGRESSWISRLVAWSPDASRLLVLKLREEVMYDERGFALPSPGWVFAEYRIIDAADGRILHRLRASPDYCGTIHHRGEWSPDGRWIVFAPHALRCN